MFELTGMTALVTGASGGIGSAVARALAAQGATVALSGTRQEALDAVKAEIGGSAVTVPANLADKDSVEGLIPAALEALGGKLDILVNNAGVTRDNLTMRMKDEEWDQVISVNLQAAFRLIRAAARPMMKARFGRIVSITSVVGWTGNPGQANYAASKGGLTAMSKALAQEFASRQITVNCVAPGFIASAMTDALNEQPRGGSRFGWRHWRGGSLSCEQRGRLRHRTDHPRQRRHGHVLTRLLRDATPEGRAAANQDLGKAETMSDTPDRVKKIVVEHLGVEPEKVTEDASFIDDLGADSLDIVELVMAFEEEFGVEIPDDAAEKITTVKDAISYIDTHKG